MLRPLERGSSILCRQNAWLCYLRAFGFDNSMTTGSGPFVVNFLLHHFPTSVLSPWPKPNGHWRFVPFQTLGIIDIGEIYTRLAYTKRMVDLVNFPNAMYNQGSQGLYTIVVYSFSKIVFFKFL